MRATLFLSLLAASTIAACSRPEATVEPVRAVRTMTIAAESSAGVHEYAAEVRARTESRLGFRVGGKIVRRAVNLGDTVNAGQLLAQLDPRDLRLAQDAARAALVAAQANLDHAAADFRRFRELRDQGFISSAELERRDTAHKAAQAQYEQARAQAGVQSNQAAYASLLADAPGVITGVDAEPGMVVAPGATVLRLAHDGPRDAVFAVPEDQVGLFKALTGQEGRVRIRLWGGGAAPLPARIREIAAAADPVTRTFLVKADLGTAGVSSGLRLGQTATALIEMPRHGGVVRLPLAALREDRGATAVWVLDPASMTVRSQAVRIAGADGNQAVIADGLRPGQVVVTAGVHVLSPGQKVKLWSDPGPGRAADRAASAASASAS